MDAFWITLLSIAAGAIGYLIATFWVRPILRYKDLKYQVASDLVFYANAIRLQKQDGTLRTDTLARVDANRRHAADLTAIDLDLPKWYHWWLKTHDENPGPAASALTGLSNEFDPKTATELIAEVKRCLRMSLHRP